MASLNSCYFIGNAAREPEIKYTEGNRKLARFSIAVNRVTGTGDARQQVTMWLDCLAYDRLAEKAQSEVRKGVPVFVQGYLQIRDWTDRAGAKRTATELVLRDLQVLERREAPAEAAPGAADDDIFA